MEVIHPTVATIVAAVTLLQVVVIALIVMMVDIAVVLRLCAIIIMTNPATMVVIGLHLVVELADHLWMNRTRLLGDMTILMVLLLHVVIQMIPMRQTGILVAGLGDLLREAMNTIRLGVTGDFLLLNLIRVVPALIRVALFWGFDWLMMIEQTRKTSSTRPLPFYRLEGNYHLVAFMR